MPLPALKWKALAPVTLAANTIDGALDALWTAGQAATYADGTARTPGTDSAWVWSKDITSGANQATYAVPPVAGYAPAPGTVIGQAIMWCGSTVAPTNMVPYTYVQTDAKTASMLYCGCVKNTTGIYNGAGAWNTATPFTTGTSTGFARAFVLPASGLWGSVYVYESPEAVIVVFARSGVNPETSWSGAGALGDPGLTSLGETDGRVYGVFTSGSNNYNGINMWANKSDTAFWETSIAGQSRFGLFVPGTATISGYNRTGDFAPATTFLARGNEVPLVPVYCTGSLAASLPPPIRLREIYLSTDGRTGQVLSNAGVTLGYVLGSYWRTASYDAAVITV